MRHFKFIGSKKDAEDYQDNIPKLGRIYDEDDIIGNFNECAVSLWNEIYPEEWEEIIVSDSDVKWTPIIDGWISINDWDRIPDDRQECILYSDGVLSGYIFDKKNNEWHDGWEGLTIIKYPTHWMPLPKPPTK